MPKRQSGNPAKRVVQKPKVEHRHAEAFCLMKYRAEDRHLEEVLWNSRDGVTPFMLTMRDGSYGSHVDWRNDQYAPDHRPQVGDRIFIDLTEQRAHEVVTEIADKIWNGPREADLSYDPEEVYGSYEALRASLLEGLLDEVRRGAPDVVEVTEEYARARGWSTEERDATRLQRMLDLQRVLDGS